jgi:group I intron endonuclease
VTKPFGVIYLITNRNDGKYYIGKTIQPIIRRWNSHLKMARNGSLCHLHAAVRKYGIDAFDIEVIAEAGNHEHLNNLETLWIIALRCYESEVGYNSTFGGEGGRFNAEVRAKLSRMRKGKPTPQFQTPEARAKGNAALKGRKLSDEHRRNIGKGLLASGRTYKPLSDDVRQRIGANLRGARNPNFGKERSPEHCENLRKALTGRQFSEETKARMSRSATARYAKRRKEVSGSSLDLFPS